MTEQPQFQTAVPSNKNYSFRYPSGGQTIELHTTDRGFLTRVLGLIDGKPLQIDIETSNEEVYQAEMDQVVPDSMNVAEDGIGPYKLELKTAAGSRKIKRVFDGGKDLGYMDLTFLKITSGYYRIAMLCDVDRYDKARRVLEMIIHSFSDYSE
jgi:hypothetical protein